MNHHDVAYSSCKGYLDMQEYWICARKPHPTGKYLLYDLYQGAGISIEYINWLIAKDIMINFYTVIFW